MKRLQDMSIGNRIALTFAIVIIILFVLALIGFLGGRWEDASAAPAPALYSDIPLDSVYGPKLLALDKDALDDAYRGHAIRLWNVWLTDGAKEAHRITNGLRIARGAYHQAAEQIAKREQQLQQQK